MKPVFIILLGFVSAITYFFALLIGKEEIESKREKLLFLGIFLVLLPLLFFKYYGLINDGIFSIIEKLGVGLEFSEITMLLPIGISFYTFMAIGYLIDIYNEEFSAEKNFGLVMLFLSFFPLVLSGPIERAPSMIPQFKNHLRFNYKMAVNGFQMMLWGYFMKLVIADRLALYVQPVFSQVENFSGKTLFLATLLYPIQVYGDLGGYSLLAIGTASIMGIKVRDNFKRPFFATSMSEFWRRWHMSLITWITDYLYTPLSFTFRKYKVRGIVMALMITFIIAGAWHGAAFTFIFWGFVQGVVLSLEALTKKQKTTIEQKYKLDNRIWYTIFGIIMTYLLFSFSLLFGGATGSLSESFIVIKKIFLDSSTLFMNKTVLLYASIGLSMLFLSEFRDEFFPDKLLLFRNRNVVVRWISYFFVLVIIALAGVFEGSEFIYFKF